MSTGPDLREESQRASALAMAGALAASVAHELRNTLAALETSIFLAQRHVEDRARVVEHLGRAEVEVRKAQDVIDRVLGLARGEPLRLEPALICELFASAHHELLAMRPCLEVSVIPRDLEIVCDPILIERVIVNLIANARDAVEDRASAHIALRARREGDIAVIEVEDDGPGIEPSIVDRIFEPAVTSKATGTGLGLHLCRAITLAHGGTIEARSAPSGGALMRLCLPLPRD